MPKARALKGFMRHDEEVQAGQEFDCDKHELNKWASLGFVEAYERKVQPKPENRMKPGKSSAASQAAPARQQPTRKKRTKKQTK